MPSPLVASIISRFAAVGLHLLEPRHDENWAYPHENGAHREDHHGSGPHERRMGPTRRVSSMSSVVVWLCTQPPTVDKLSEHRIRDTFHLS